MAGRRASTPYYHHCSPDDPATLRTVSDSLRNSSESRQELFSPLQKFKLELFLAPVFRTEEPFLPVFHFVFLQRFGSPAASPCLATPGPRSYLGEAHFLGEISQPPPWALHLSDEQLKHGCSLSARDTYQRGRAPPPPPPSGLAALSTCITDITFSLFSILAGQRNRNSC